MKHYRWWLERELDFVQPKLVVALGATAALALAGKAMPVAANRGHLLTLDGRPGLITIHPSFLLRMPDEDKAMAWKAFVSDLKLAKTLSLQQAAA